MLKGRKRKKIKALFMAMALLLACWMGTVWAKPINGTPDANSVITNPTATTM